MRCGLTHLELPVSRLSRSRPLYEHGAGFQPVAETADGVDLEAGGIVLRLCRRPVPFPTVVLRLQTNDPAAAASTLVGRGAIPIQPAEKVADRELRATVEDPDGHRLILWRRLRESELDHPVDLPTVLFWHAPAGAVLNSLLSRVPELWRDLAREGSVAEAEHLSAGGPVRRAHAIRGFIRSSPRLYRDNLRGTLLDHGICPEDYTDDFLC